MRKPRYTKIFSYYGSKSKLASKYPAPKHDMVIEPFAGSAAYSLAHAERRIWINEKDPITASVWKFLLQHDAMDWLERAFPRTVTKGQTVTDILDVPNVPEGLFHLCRAEANQASFGTTGKHTVITTWGARDWHRILPRLQYWIPRINHWHFTAYDYLDIPDCVATWFIDPPYANAAGSMYRTNGVDYTQLGEWCRSRNGQIVVCENVGAEWLPFQKFSSRAGCYTGRDYKTTASGLEVIWMNENG